MKINLWVLAAAVLILFPALTAGQSMRLYTGKYNDQGGTGFQLIDLDLKAGAFRIAAEADAGPNPSYFCIAPTRDLIYAINEVDEMHGRKAGGITTLAVDPASGAVRKVSELAVPNGGPCFISQTADGMYLLVANYGGGSVAVVRLDDCGIPSVVTDTLLFRGPSGSSSRAHMIAPGPDGKRIYVTDLGLDRITVFVLDRATGKLQALPNGETGLTRGAGPRHFTFSRDGSILYVINERNSTLTVFAVSSQGLLQEIQTVSTLPEGYNGTNHCADIHLGKSGKYLYGTNRGHNSIVTFRVGRKGGLTLAGHTSCGGDWPRNFVIDPSGRYMIVANQRSNTLNLFALDKRSGLPRPMPASCTTHAPACLQFAVRPGPSAGQMGQQGR
ncbi:MAG TPA: lactonase family protein [bacterium]|nr:lactonase family protein [bacterium]HQG45030.1 lactonase family protein [bacterium]HQI49160.1 lactonase family protein [bacterium]HQJ63979.1 lactonase family protein [bacterium]